MSLLFTNASSDRVDNNTTDSLDNLTAGSMITWIYRTTSSTDRFIWCKGRTDLSRAKYVKINSSDAGQGAGSMQMGIYRATSPFIVEPTSTGILVDTWMCVACVWDTAGVAGDQHFYIGSMTADLAEPGAYTTRTVGSGTPVDDSADIFVTGNHPVANNLSFAGRIAWLTVWNRVLSLTELKEQQWNPTPTTGCVMLHEYDNATTVPDDSGNDNFGTVTGATLADSPPIPRSLAFFSPARRRGA